MGLGSRVVAIHGRVSQPSSALTTDSILTTTGQISLLFPMWNSRVETELPIPITITITIPHTYYTFHMAVYVYKCILSKTSICVNV